MRKNMGASGFIIFSALFLMFAALLVPATLAITSCERVDDCTCKTNDGQEISLWELDSGSSTSPSFTGIMDASSDNFKFLWNPCTLFSKDKCKDALVCQTGFGDYYSCGGKGTKFSIDGGNVVITYPAVTQEKHTRQAIFTLKCDKSVAKADFGEGIEEIKYPSASTYTATIKTKCACPGMCPNTGPAAGSSRISIGSILLIIFFPLVLLYCVAGVLFNKFHKGTSGVPEVIPNHSFWGDFPFLVKDGCVFVCSAIGRGCRTICGKIRGESYASI